MATNIDPALPAREITRFSIDSRDVQAGDLFFALSQPDYQRNGFNGEFDDATKYAAGALESGAAACVLRPDRFEEHRAELKQYEDRLIFVDDVILALQRLAHGVYLEWNKPVVAITGSAGKTTAKEITAHVLETGGRKVLRNEKNYNNGLGHPLTVLSLAKDRTPDVAVLEMGMSTPMNEIQRLCRITPPDVAVELNVFPVHVEHLGSIENVAKAKAELVEGMKPDGTAVLNADDERVLAMRDLTHGKILTFGIDHEADVRATGIELDRFGDTRFTLEINGEAAPVAFPLNGRHNVLNALAAAAVGHLFGMPAEKIAGGLATVEPPPQRGEVLRFANGVTVINDSYNSNPTALLSMARTLIDGRGDAMRTVVFAGEMLELGETSASVHRETGRELADIGVDVIVGIRGLARHLVEGATAAGHKASQFAEDSEAAADIAVKELRRGDLVLIKGSRGVRTEKVVERLLAEFDLEDKDARQR